MDGPSTTAFILGFIVGAAVFWHVSLAVERFRRARYDFRATRQGIRTLAEMMVHRGWQAVKGVLVAALVIGLLLAWWSQQGID